MNDGSKNAAFRRILTHGLPEDRWTWILCLTLVLGLLAGRTQVHLCDSDAQLYRVVARNMVEHRDAFDLTYTPAVHPKFREHLPFGLWPTALAIGAFGEGALRWLDGLWVVILLWVVGGTAHRMFDSFWAAAGAVFVLGTTDSFVRFASFPRLDGLTALLSTLSAVPWLFEIPRGRKLAASALWAALACLVKGPFGLVPVCSAALARAVTSRSWRALAWGIGTAALAAAPTTAFLLYDRAFADGSWWTGYVKAQLLSSAVGGRTDGVSTAYHPFIALAHQFWPGLAVLPFAVLRARREGTEGRKALWLVFIFGLLALCLPHRKLPHHVAVLYPLAAILAGETMGAGMAWVAERTGALRHSLSAFAFAGWALVLAGHPLWTRDADCILRSQVGDILAELPSGTNVLLISQTAQWRNVAALAAERRVVAWPAASWGEAMQRSIGPEVAVVAEPRREPPAKGFVRIRAASDWSVWRRSPNLVAPGI